jgi:hypothetical protein
LIAFELVQPPEEPDAAQDLRSQRGTRVLAEAGDGFRLGINIDAGGGISLFYDAGLLRGKYLP